LNWKAILQVILTGALNGAVGYLAAHATGSAEAGLGLAAAGTVAAHALPSPFKEGK